jgi:hypothetical protein
MRWGWFGGMLAVTVVLCAVVLPSQAVARYPTWGIHKMTLSISYEACIGLARLAIKEHGFKSLYGSQGLTLAQKDNHLVSIACNRAPDSKTVVDILVATSDGTGPISYAVVEQMTAEMRKPNCRPTPWGFRHCHVGS